jgi:hypothetical protein
MAWPPSAKTTRETPPSPCRPSSATAPPGSCCSAGVRSVAALQRERYWHRGRAAARPGTGAPAAGAARGRLVGPAPGGRRAGDGEDLPGLSENAAKGQQAARWEFLLR